MVKRFSVPMSDALATRVEAYVTKLQARSHMQITKGGVIAALVNKALDLEDRVRASRTARNRKRAT